MRSYLAGKRTYSVSDLKRIATDFRVNALRAKTEEGFKKNFSEFRAVLYALIVAESGRAPQRGRPSKRALFYLDRTSRNTYRGNL